LGIRPREEFEGGVRGAFTPSAISAGTGIDTPGAST
jgi:hypothetical protein